MLRSSPKLPSQPCELNPGPYTSNRSRPLHTEFSQRDRAFVAVIIVIEEHTFHGLLSSHSYMKYSLLKQQPDLAWVRINTSQVNSPLLSACQLTENKHRWRRTSQPCQQHRSWSGSSGRLLRFEESNWHTGKEFLALSDAPTLFSRVWKAWKYTCRCSSINVW